MSDKGLPQPMIKKIVNFIIDIKNGDEAEVTNELEIKLGHTPISLPEGLNELFAPYQIMKL